MEERKFDPYQFIGFVLIALILTWMLYRNAPEEAAQTTPEPTPAVATPEATPGPATAVVSATAVDTSMYGPFAGFMQANAAAPQQLENEFMQLKIQPKGGQIEQLLLKGETNYKGEPLYLIDGGNANFSVSIPLQDGRVLRTEDFYFSAVVEGQSVVLTAKASEGKQLRFIYRLNPKTHLLDFSMDTTGMAAFLDSSRPATLRWTNDAFRNSKSIEYENRYTELTYGHREDKVDYLSIAGEDQETENQVRWVSYRQHFFSAILLFQNPVDTVTLTSVDLSDDETLDEAFTKRYTTSVPLTASGSELTTALQFYFGPTDYKTLKSYNQDLESSVPLGWGIFGWINRFIFLPLFSFLTSFLPHGIAIIVLTIIVRLAMSPVTYKSYVSQIKMKILRPEVDEINKKYAKDAVKKQQEVMSLYSRAGASPMSGCVPALLQMPVFFALFTFFPVAFSLRQKPFLWADDLSSYDAVVDLPFNIPFYGDHISLFPILASVAIFYYTRMTTGQQSMPQQPGMPNMKVIMYLMPLMMLFFFNNYASGLSLYYFVSNLLTIILMLVIKNYIIDDDKILLQIEENKKKPKKAGGFSARLQKAMEEAEKQKRAQGRR